MNLATIEAIRHGIGEIAKQAQVGRHGDDFNTGATEMQRRIDNYLCELIAEHGGEVKDPPVFRYIEVRQRGAGVLHREPVQQPGSMAIWAVRIKQLKQEFAAEGIYADVYEYEAAQILNTAQEQEPKIPWDELEYWAEWVAMDADGQWWQYEEEPRPLKTAWSSSTHTNADKTNLIPFTAPDWRTSLCQRPAKTTEQ